MRKTLQCPRCESLRIGYFDAVRDAAGFPADRSLGTTLRERGLFDLPEVVTAAAVEAFVCTECGYFEEYVKDPSSVLWDELKHFHWCRPEQSGQGPFRGG